MRLQAWLLVEEKQKWICNVFMEEFIIIIYLILSQTNENRCDAVLLRVCVYVCTYQSKVFMLYKSKENRMAEWDAQ